MSEFDVTVQYRITPDQPADACFLIKANDADDAMKIATRETWKRPGTCSVDYVRAERVR